MLHAARGKYRMQKIAKNSLSAHHCTILSGYIFTAKERINNQKKNLSNCNISSSCSHNMVNFGPLTPEICWQAWCTGNKFQQVSHLAFVTAPASLNGGQPNFAGCLAISRVGTLCIHSGVGLLPPNRILPGSKFTLRPNLALSYRQHYCTALRDSSSGHQPNFVAFNRGRYLYSAGWPSCWASAHILV